MMGFASLAEVALAENTGKGQATQPTAIQWNAGNEWQKMDRLEKPYLPQGIYGNLNRRPWVR